MNLTISSWFGWKATTKLEKNVSKMRYNILYSLKQKDTTYWGFSGWHSYNVTTIFCLSPCLLSLSFSVSLSLSPGPLHNLPRMCLLYSCHPCPQLWPNTWTTWLVLQILSLPLGGAPNLWHHFQRPYAFLQ